MNCLRELYAVHFHFSLGLVSSLKMNSNQIKASCCFLGYSVFKAVAPANWEGELPLVWSRWARTLKYMSQTHNCQPSCLRQA